MAITLETAWGAGTVPTNVGSFGLQYGMGGFLGTGAELMVTLLIMDTSNGCTGVNISHSTFNAGAAYVGTPQNGALPIIVWGVYSGLAATPTMTATTVGGNTGINGGRQWGAVFVGQAPTIVASPGPFAPNNGTSPNATTTITGVTAGSMILAVADNNGGINQNFSAGSGYTIAVGNGNWVGHTACAEYNTGYSSVGGTATASMSLPSNAWTMLAAAFPADLGSPPLPPQLAGRCRYILP